MTSDVVLREVVDADLPIFFEQQMDRDANYAAAFTAKDPTDRAAFLSHWAHVRADPSTTNRTILYGTQVAGMVACYEERPGEPEVTYWLGKPYWGKGIATAALTAFLAQVTPRPIYARAAKDNLASLRVLAKCGFAVIGQDKGFANARGVEVEEYLLRLD